MLATTSATRHLPVPTPVIGHSLAPTLVTAPTPILATASAPILAPATDISPLILPVILPVILPALVKRPPMCEKQSLPTITSINTTITTTTTISTST
jgi:hypothetical protein